MLSPKTNEKLSKNRQERRFFNWFEQNEADIAELYEIVMQYLKNNKLTDELITHDKIWYKFVHFIYINSTAQPIKTYEIKLNVSEEHHIEIENTFQAKYSEYIENLHYILKQYCEQSGIELYDRYTETLYEFFSKNSMTTRRKIYNDILKREEEERKQKADEEYTTNSHYYVNNFDEYNEENHNNN